jgi:uncharacterized protein (DUF433 family)
MARQISPLDHSIDRYIVRSPQTTPDRALLAGSGIEVWAIIGYLRGFDIDQTATDYDVPREAVEAALAYYERHRKVIDARLELNDAAFDADGE